MELRAPLEASGSQFIIAELDGRLVGSITWVTLAQLLVFFWDRAVRDTERFADIQRFAGLFHGHGPAATLDMHTPGSDQPLGNGTGRRKAQFNQNNIGARHDATRGQQQGARWSVSGRALSTGPPGRGYCSPSRSMAW